MYCPNCGKNNDGSTAFCSECGKPLKGGQASAKQLGKPASKTIVLVISALLILSAVYWIYSTFIGMPKCNSSKVQKTVLNLIKEVNQSFKFNKQSIFELESIRENSKGADARFCSAVLHNQYEQATNMEGKFVVTYMISKDSRIQILSFQDTGWNPVINK